MRETGRGPENKEVEESNKIYNKGQPDILE
jgi:hypothetical protein